MIFSTIQYNEPEIYFMSVIMNKWHQLKITANVNMDGLMQYSGNSKASEMESHQSCA